MPAATPAPAPAVVDAEVADTDASSPHATAAGPIEKRPTASGALMGLSLIVGAVAPVAQPALVALPGLVAANAPGEAPWQMAAVATPPTLAQVVASMEAAVRDLRILHSNGNLSGEMASRRAAWVHDLRACEEELRCRGDQVQMMLMEAARQEEAMAMQEQRLETELGTIPACE